MRSIFGLTAVFFLSQVASAADWTILVYMNGHNSLEKFVDLDILEMEAVGSTENTQVIVQWAGTSLNETRRLRIEKSNDPHRIISPVLEHLAPVDMGDPKSLIDFVAWGVRKYPANHYALIIWNHGSGWHGSSGDLPNTSANELRSTDISYDDRFRSSINTEELGSLMASVKDLIGKNLDLLVMDACYMAMTEVFTQFQDSVDYAVASQEVEPSGGIPYTEALNSWSSDPRQTAINITNAYWSYYGSSNSFEKLGQSAIDLKFLAPLNQSLRNLAEPLKSLSGAKLQSWRGSQKGAIYFAQPDYGDLGSILNSASPYVDPDLLLQTKQLLTQAVISNPSSTKYHTSGLSIWVPKKRDILSEFSSQYRSLEFNQATDWLSVLINLLSP